MPHRDRNDADGVDTLCPWTAETITHMRALAFESLSREAAYLVRHAEDAWMGEPARCNEDAEMTAQHVRRTFSVLDQIGWQA